MKLNTLAAVAAITLAVVTASVAQDAPKQTPPQTPPSTEAKRLPLVDQLNLSETQRPKWDAIMKDAGDKNRAIREDKAMSGEQKQAKIKSLQEETNKKLQAILTKDQNEQWQKIRDSRKPPVKATPRKQ